jgi:phosphatidate phosphatase PAH1
LISLGPILLNEQTLFEAFKTELIYKTSGEIKIKLLKLIENIFDLSAGSCFSAGFGNRPNVFYS